MRLSMIGMLIGLLNSNSETLKKRAASSLVKQGDKAIAPLIEEMRSNRKLRMDIAAILVRIGAPAVEPLKKLLTDKDEDLVLTAKAALKELGVEPESSPSSAPTSGPPKVKEETEKKAESWNRSIMRCINDMGKSEFSLQDLYQYKERLAALHPRSKNIEAKIGQQLQLLRDQGILEFLGNGRYRIAALKTSSRWIIRTDPTDLTSLSNAKVGDVITLRVKQRANEIRGGDTAVLCSAKETGEIFIHGISEVTSDPAHVSQNKPGNYNERDRVAQVELCIKEKPADAPISVMIKNTKGLERLSASELSKGYVFLLNDDEWRAVSRIFYDYERSVVSRIFYEAALINAAERVDTDTINRLIKKGVDINAKDKDGRTAIMVAARNGYVDAVRALIEAGADLDVKNENGWTALMWAAYKDQTETVKALIEAGADLDAQEKNRLTALMLAARNGYVDAVRALIDAGADLNLQNNKSWTALMTAVENGYLDIVKALIEAGADVNVKNEDGRTALMLAARNGYVDAVRALIDAGADLNLQNNKSWTALMTAVENGYLDIVKALIEAGADVNVEDEDGWTALMLAAYKGQTETARALVEAGADVDEAIEWAIENNKSEALKTLREVTGSAGSKNEKERTSLIRAATNGYAEVAKALIKAGEDLDAQEKKGWTALMRAAYNGQTETVKALIETGAEVNARNDGELTALMIAAEKGYVDVVKVLIEAGADVDEAIEWATENNKSEALKTLREVTGSAGSKNEKERTSLIHQNKKEQTSLIQAATNGYAEVAKALMKAVCEGNAKDVRALIKAGADVNAKDEYGQTPLMRAAGLGRTETAKALIDAGADVNAKAEDGRTPLMWATGWGRTETAKALIDAGADVNAKDEDGRTPLMNAAVLGQTETAKALIDAGADVNAKDEYGQTPLMWAAGLGRTETAKALIDAGADVNAKDEDGRTPLMRAAGLGRTETAKALIDAGADVNAKDEDGSTALTLATFNNHAEIVKALIEAGAADINAALTLAVSKGESEIVKILREAMAETKPGDNRIMQGIKREIAKSAMNIDTFPERISNLGVGVIRELVTWLNDQDWRVRWVAVRSLERIAPSLSREEREEIEDRFAYALKKEENQLVRSTLIEASGKIAPFELSETYDQDDAGITPADLKTESGEEAGSVKDALKMAIEKCNDLPGVWRDSGVRREKKVLEEMLNREVESMKINAKVFVSTKPKRIAFKVFSRGGGYNIVLFAVEPVSFKNGKVERFSGRTDEELQRAFSEAVESIKGGQPVDLGPKNKNKDKREPGETSAAEITTRSTKVKKDKERELALVRTSRDVGFLVGKLSSEDEDIRDTAVLSLARLKDARSVEYLNRYLLKDPSARVRGDCAMALGEIGDPRAIEALSKACQDRDERVKRSADRALKKIRR